MDTTEIIMIKYIITITLNHHLKPSYCISIVSRMKSVENYPCEVPVNVIPSKPKQDPITTILAQVCCHLPTKTQQVQHFIYNYIYSYYI